MTSTTASTPPHAEHVPVQAIGQGLTLVLIALSVISVLLAGAQSFGLTQSQATALIVSNLGLAALLCIVPTLLLRQPVLMGLGLTSFLFVVSLSDTYTYREATGGILVAGAIVILAGALGISRFLSALIPAPIVFGVVAGAVMPFVVGVFTDMSDLPRIIGPAVATYLLARRFLPARIPPILPTMIVGFVAAEIAGLVHGVGLEWSIAAPATVTPAFSWHAILSIAPVVATLTVASSNLTSIVYMRSQGFTAPERPLQVITGVGTMVGSLFGLNPMTMQSFAMPLVAGPDAGEREQRVWAVYVAAGGFALLALLGGLAARIPSMIPAALIFAIAGLSLLGVLGHALIEITKGPLRIGPLFAFVVASSNLSLRGFGPAFWGLVIGTVVMLLLESEEWKETRRAASDSQVAR